MAISLEPFERQFLDFGNAVGQRSQPLVSGEEGYRALEIVDGKIEFYAKWLSTGVQPPLPYQGSKQS